MLVPKQSLDTSRRIAVIAAAATVLVSAAVLVLVLLSIVDPANTSAAGYAPLAWSALFVLLAVLLVAICVRRIDLRLSRGFPWIVGLVSAAAALVPWWALAGGNQDLGTLMYRGLRIPQGIMQFWDLSVVMLSVDCARWGFDIYADNNGCMQEASIYAPGMVWLQYVPFQMFSQANIAVLGVVMIVISSLALVWLARQSTGLGQIAFLIAAVGAPWVLLLERGNIDAVVLWSVVVVVLIVRRWNNYWAWSIGALLLWLMGTWKYYPFALGVMLLPALRLRYGWTVLVGYGVAATGFMIVTWNNFRFSASSNSGMVDYGDFAVLGRIPVVARMLGTEVGAVSIQFGDALIFLAALLAALWGIGIGLCLRRQSTWLGMLAVGGSGLYLVSVVVSGFGYGYKAVFLLLAVPLVSRLIGHRMRIVAASGLGVLLLLAVQSLVGWNTVMVTTAGIIASGFALGLSGTILVRDIWPMKRRPVLASA